MVKESEGILHEEWKQMKAADKDLFEPVVKRLKNN